MLVLASTSANAHVLFDRSTLRQWNAESAAVAVVRFESDVQMWRAGDGSDRQEFFRVRVLETLTGALPPGPLDFFPHAEGFPSFRAGDRALLFLERTADRVEFATLAARFPWYSAQGAGQEWKLPDGAEGDAIVELAKRLAALRAARPAPDARNALRDHLLAELSSGVPRLRMDAISELILARGWPGFLDAETTPAFATFTASRALPATERLALVRLLDGAPGFDADARLLALTREPLAGRELTQLVRTAGSRDSVALRDWLTALANDPRPEVQREARAALQAGGMRAESR